ncbi:MAG: glutamate synthase subunit beta [Candidatus Omnitrophota bacterium]|nr:glutamate synthase subunit beta [Candidatus Omnitrophota bacterium]MDZ4242015.1 glutamate synthase subunit beta [Candidatus Omnitrophota bacterium]
MGDAKGFMKYDREDFHKQPAPDRIRHWKEFYLEMPEEDLRKQGARCMDCGVPFCQSGCPIGNIIPDWNDLVYNNRWQEAIERLHKTNNFPEFTGRVCPAPCENSCVLGINAPPVTIKNIEVSIIEKAYEEGFIKPLSPKHRTGLKVAVVGSGPAGLACADQLNKAGHTVTVYEKNEEVGGLLMFGIPDFKLGKWVVKRRVKRMEQEGVKIKAGVHVGVDVSARELAGKHDAVVLCGGAEQPRDIPIPGRELKGIHFAMEFLAQQNRVNMGQHIKAEDRILAEGKSVVVLGGGDTGSDCIGTSNRQGAKQVYNFELLARPPKSRDADNPWPQWAFIERSSTSHDEGCERDYGVMTKRFSGENGRVKKLHAVRLEFGPKDPKTGRRDMKEIPGSEFEVDADLVLLALGFLGPVKNGMLQELGVALDERGNVKTDNNRMTSVPGIFAAGDMRRGQSLVVWAINEGRAAAEGVHGYLMSAKESGAIK